MKRRSIYAIATALLAFAAWQAYASLIVVGGPTGSVSSDPPGEATSVIWALEIDAGEPWNTSGFRQNSADSNFNAETDVVSDGTLGVDVLRNAFWKPYDDEGGPIESYWGFNVSDGEISDTPFITANKLHVRYLIKYGETANSGWWANVSGKRTEYKAFDIKPNDTRILFVHRQAVVGYEQQSDDVGAILVSLRGTDIRTFAPTAAGGVVNIDASYENDQTAQEELASGTWYWWEVGIDGATGEIDFWIVPWDGTDTEYSEGSPTHSSGASAHTYNLATIWTASSPTGYDHGYANHGVSSERRVYWGPSGVAISDAFIGPGAVESDTVL